MNAPRALVVSSVHPPDDPRIRHKLAETLRSAFDVRLAVPEPGPATSEGIDVVVLTGGRLRRWLQAGRLLVRGGYDVASVHDPELLPAALVAALAGRRVVFDLHEDLPAQLAAKPWMPASLHRPVAMLACGVLRLTERVVEVTLAEDSYQRRFSRRHPVFANYLADVDMAVVPVPERTGAIYLGDVTEARGADLAVAAAGASGIGSLTLIGRCAPDLRVRLERDAARAGVSLTMTGFLPPASALPLVASHAVALSPLRDLPNYRHSLPTKLLEYLALGLPVVASDLPGSRDVVDGAGGVVWVKPGDATALAAGIDRVLDDPELAARAAGGAAAIRERYRWPADDVLSFYLGR